MHQTTQMHRTRAPLYSKSRKARVEDVASCMTCPSRHSWALLSKGGAEAGNLAELQDALALSPVGFRVEGVLPTSL